MSCMSKQKNDNVEVSRDSFYSLHLSQIQTIGDNHYITYGQPFFMLMKHFLFGINARMACQLTLIGQLVPE
jgi:hypothetical protein